jgi:hypothetical protein
MPVAGDLTAVIPGGTSCVVCDAGAAAGLLALRPAALFLVVLVAMVFAFASLT